jgi:hypothetical protein
MDDRIRDFIRAAVLEDSVQNRGNFRRRGAL